MKILPRIMQTAKHKKFTYVPRYYDADKEDFDKRMAAIKAEIAAEKGEDAVFVPGQHITRIKGRIKSSPYRYNLAAQKRTSNMRIFAILVGLIIAVYYLLD